MTAETEEQQTTLFVSMSPKHILSIALVGGIVGVVTWGLVIVLDTYLFKGVLCRDAFSAKCMASPAYANMTASIVAAGLGLLAFVRLQVFRALVVIIAATAALWGLPLFAREWPWVQALVVSLLAYALAYLLFAWLARVRMFVIALLLIVVTVVGIRLILNS